MLLWYQKIEKQVVEEEVKQTEIVDFGSGKLQAVLMQGDCLEHIQRIQGGSVDMILTDPPYSSGGLTAGDRKKSTKDKYTSLDFNGAARFANFEGDNMDQRSCTEFWRQVFTKARSKTKAGGILAAFTDWRQLPAMTDAVQMAGWLWRGIVVWDKGTSRNIQGRYRNDCEYIVWASNGPRKVEYKKGFAALPGCYRVGGVSSAAKRHQTQKPVELLERLLDILPEPGGVVLDLFMGSGSTGVACINRRQNFIGMELSPIYFETAKQRIVERVREDGADRANQPGFCQGQRG